MAQRSRVVTGAIAQVPSNAVSPGASGRTPDLLRGRRLHDDGCLGCHGPSMYARLMEERNLYFSVRQQVKLWQEFIGLNWGDDQIDDVAYYVQKEFYEAQQE